MNYIKTSKQNFISTLRVLY